MVQASYRGQMSILIFLFIHLIFAVPNTIELLPNGIKINGEYRILRGGSFQWFRIPQEEWEDRMIRFKALGHNFIDMYVAWRNHEPEENVYDWETFNIKRFLWLAKRYGMYVYFRPGPYITNEMYAFITLIQGTPEDFHIGSEKDPTKAYSTRTN
jgi:beta-galactosidase GanA